MGINGGYSWINPSLSAEAQRAKIEAEKRGDDPKIAAATVVSVRAGGSSLQKAAAHFGHIADADDDDEDGAAWGQCSKKDLAEMAAAAAAAAPAPMRPASDPNTSPKKKKAPAPKKPTSIARAIETCGGQFRPDEPPMRKLDQLPYFCARVVDLICFIRNVSSYQEPHAIGMTLLKCMFSALASSHILAAYCLDDSQLDPAKIAAHKRRYDPATGASRRRQDTSSRPKTEFQLQKERVTKRLITTLLDDVEKDGCFARWPHWDRRCVDGTSIKWSPNAPPGNVLESREAVYKGFVLSAMSVVRNSVMPAMSRVSEEPVGCSGDGKGRYEGQFVLVAGPRKETMSAHGEPGVTLGVTLDEIDTTTGQPASPPRKCIPLILYPHALNLLEEKEFSYMPTTDAPGASLVMFVLNTARHLASQADDRVSVHIPTLANLIGSEGPSIYTSRSRAATFLLNATKRMAAHPGDTINILALDRLLCTARRETWCGPGEIAERCVRRLYAVRHDFPAGPVPFKIEAPQADEKIRTLRVAMTGDPCFDASGVSKEDLAAFEAARVARPDPEPSWSRYASAAGGGIVLGDHPILNHHAKTRYTVSFDGNDSDRQWEEICVTAAYMWLARRDEAAASRAAAQRNDSPGPRPRMRIPVCALKAAAATTTPPPDTPTGAFPGLIDARPFGDDGQSDIPPGRADSQWARLSCYVSATLAVPGPRGGKPSRRTLYFNSDKNVYDSAQRIRTLVTKKNASYNYPEGDPRILPGGGYDFRRAPDELLAIVLAMRVFLEGNDYQEKLAQSLVYTYLLDLASFDPAQTRARHPLCDFMAIGRALDATRNMGLSSRTPAHVALDIRGMTDAILLALQRTRQTLAIKKNPRGLVASRVASLEYYLARIFTTSRMGFLDPCIFLENSATVAAANTPLSVTGFAITEDADGDGTNKREIYCGVPVSEDAASRAAAYERVFARGAAMRLHGTVPEAPWVAKHRQKTIEETLAREREDAIFDTTTSESEDDGNDDGKIQKKKHSAAAGARKRKREEDDALVPSGKRSKG